MLRHQNRKTEWTQTVQSVLVLGLDRGPRGPTGLFVIAGDIPRRKGHGQLLRPPWCHMGVWRAGSWWLGCVLHLPVCYLQHPSGPDARDIPLLSGSKVSHISLFYVCVSHDLVFAGSGLLIDECFRGAAPALLPSSPRMPLCTLLARIALLLRTDAQALSSW